jgi:hypothetical protein
VQESPETFSFAPRSAWATGDEPGSLVIHDSIVLIWPHGIDDPGKRGI